MDKPLVSLCIMFHNQKDYVERTLEGAFSQTYSPLEIVISDDASMDGTSELVSYQLKHRYCTQSYMKEKTIILNRNDNALGMLGNREKVYSIASGELLINADGDDISFPNRVELLVDAWLAKDKTTTLLTSEAIIIDERDRPLGVTQLNGKPIGATLAITTYVRDFFPPVCQDAAFHAHDDLVYHIRASLLGEIQSVNEALIYYRYGSGDSSRGKYRKKMVRGFTGIISGMKQIILDLEACRCKISSDKIKNCYDNACKEIAFAETILPLWTSPSFFLRLKALLKTKYYSYGVKIFFLCFVLLLPQILGDLLFYCGEKVKRLACLKRAKNINMNQLNIILTNLSSNKLNNIP